MTFDSFWNGLADKRPELRRDDMTIKLDVPNFQRMLLRAYAAGQDEARQEIERTADELTGDQGIMDVFNGIFGGKR